MSSETQSLHRSIKNALAGNQGEATTVLSSLLAVEDAIGYIPSEAVEQVASLMGASVNDVWGVASFYTNFRFEEPGAHVVEVCWGPTCHLLGAPKVLKEVLGCLGLDSEGESTDNGVVLKYNTCLGACAQAPVMALDHKLLGRVSPREARTRVEGLRP